MPVTPGGEGQTFLNLARQVSEAIGAKFFSTLVNQLGGVLGAECVYMGEFVQRGTARFRTLSAYVHGGEVDAFEFPLEGSPDAEVALGNPRSYARGVREAFPGDRRLRDLEAEAYVCVPLHNAEGRTGGLIAALYRHPLDLEIHFVQSMLTIFASRAAAELNRKQAEDTLRESEERYRAFVESSPDALWRAEFDEPIDTGLPEEEQLARILRDGRVAECNDAVVQRLGLGRVALIGAALSEVVPDLKSRHSSLLSMIRSGYGHITVEVAPVDVIGKRRHFLDSYWAIVEKGKLQRIWGSSRDVTQLRSLEAHFSRAQKLEGIGRLAGGVAHDFNNIMQVINTYSSQLLERTETSNPAYVGLTEIRKAAEKAHALTSQLLALSRKRTVPLQLIDLNPIVAEDEPMLRRLISENIELVTELNPSLGLVRGDVGYMHQVLVNLVANARDAMPNGGRLIVSLSNVDFDETRPARLTAVKPGPYVRLRVTDNGVGMSADVQEHLFEPFFTTKEVNQGTGLGLSTVYGIVQQCGGYITVETEPHSGTTFEIFFPRESLQPIGGLTTESKS